MRRLRGLDALDPRIESIWDDALTAPIDVLPHAGLHGKPAVVEAVHDRHQEGFQLLPGLHFEALAELAL